MPFNLKLCIRKKGKDELFFLPAKENVIRAPSEIPNYDWPVPVFNTVIPPGRHFGYVFEWAIMALMTALICLVLQLRPPKPKAT